MKTFRKYEVIIWITAACIFLIGYAITTYDMFIWFLLTYVILARIARIESNTKDK